MKPEPISIEDALAEPMDVYSHHVYRFEELRFAPEPAKREPRWLKLAGLGLSLLVLGLGVLMALYHGIGWWWG